MKSSHGDVGDADRRLQNWLLGYRATEHPTTGRSPAQLLLGRELRTRMDLMRPSTRDRVLRAQAGQKQLHDRRARHADLLPDQVWARDYRRGAERWAEGRLAEQTGPLSYRVETRDGVIERRHADQLRPRISQDPPATGGLPAQGGDAPSELAPAASEGPGADGPTAAATEAPSQLRRSHRERQEPDRLMYLKPGTPNVN